MKKLLRKIEIMVLLFAVCFIGSMYVSKSMCHDVINEDIGYMFDVISDKLENEAIQQIEQSIFLNQ